MAAEDNGVDRCANLFPEVRMGFSELRADWAAQPTSSDHIPGSFPRASHLLYQISSLSEPRISIPTNHLVTDLPTREFLVDSQGSRSQATSQDPGKLL